MEIITAEQLMEYLGECWNVSHNSTLMPHHWAKGQREVSTAQSSLWITIKEFMGFLRPSACCKHAVLKPLHWLTCCWKTMWNFMLKSSFKGERSQPVPSRHRQPTTLTGTEYEEIIFISIWNSSFFFFLCSCCHHLCQFLINWVILRQNEYICTTPLAIQHTDARKWDIWGESQKRHGLRRSGWLCLRHPRKSNHLPLVQCKV